MTKRSSASRMIEVSVAPSAPRKTADPKSRLSARRRAASRKKIAITVDDLIERYGLTKDEVVGAGILSEDSSTDVRPDTYGYEYLVGEFEALANSKVKSSSLKTPKNRVSAKRRAMAAKRRSASRNKVANEAFALVGGEELRLFFNPSDGHWIVTGLDSAGRMEGVVAQGSADSFHQAVNAADAAVAEWAGVPGAVFGWSASRVSARKRVAEVDSGDIEDTVEEVLSDAGIDAEVSIDIDPDDDTEEFDQEDDNNKPPFGGKESKMKEMRVARARALARKRANTVQDPEGRKDSAPGTTDVTPDATVTLDDINEGIEDGTVTVEVVPTTKGARRNRGQAIAQARRRALAKSRKRADSALVTAPEMDKTAPGTTDVTPDAQVDVTDINGRSINDDMSQFEDKQDDVLMLPGGGKASALQIARIAQLRVQAGLEDEASSFEKMAEYENLSEREASNILSILGEVAATRTKEARVTTEVPFSATPSFGQRSASTVRNDSTDVDDFMIGL